MNRWLAYHSQYTPEICMLFAPYWLVGIWYHSNVPTSRLYLWYKGGIPHNYGNCYMHPLNLPRIDWHVWHCIMVISVALHPFAPNSTNHRPSPFPVDFIHNRYRNIHSDNTLCRKQNYMEITNQSLSNIRFIFFMEYLLGSKLQYLCILGIY